MIRVQNLNLITILSSLLVFQSVTSQQVYGDDNESPHARIMSLLDKGACLEAKQTARSVLEKAIQDSRPLGEIASCLEDYSRALNSVKKYQDALTIIEKANSIREDDKEFSLVMRTGNMRIECGAYIGLGDISRARETIDKALELCRKTKNPDAMCYVEALNLSSFLYMREQKLDQAEEHSRKAFEILVKFSRDSGDVDSSLGFTLSQLALINLERGKIDEAKEYAVRALTIRNLQLSKKPQDAANSLEILGLIELENGQCAKALVYLDKSLGIREGMSAEHNPKVIWFDETVDLVYDNLCQTCVSCSSLVNKEIEIYERVFIKWLKYRETYYGTSSVELMSPLVLYSEFLGKLGRQQERSVVNKRIDMIHQQQKENAGSVLTPRGG